MVNSFYNELNNNLVQALNENVAFILNQEDTFLPPIINPLAGTSITGANFINMTLSNNLNGTNFTEFVNMSQALSAGVEWLSGLAQGNNPKGIAFQEDGMSPNPRYSFMMPAAELNQDMLKENRKTVPQGDYVPFQSNNTKMSDFGNFVQEQFANAINASLSGCPFKSNVPENAMDQFKTALINEVTRNPLFVADAANKAQQNVNEFHHLPIDRSSFIEKARNEGSNEFKQVNSAIAEHVTDMCQNGKKSFNPQFDELAKPLVNNIKHFDSGGAGQGQQPAVGQQISDFVKEMMKLDGPAAVLVDTCIGTLVEKTKKLVQSDDRVSAGVALACSIAEPALAGKFTANDFINIADNIITFSEAMGNNNIKNARDSGDTRSLNGALERIIQDTPQVLTNAISQLTGNRQQEHVQSAGARR